MRTILAAAFLLGLAACSESGATDQEVRSGLRASSLEACETDAREDLTRTRQWSEASAGDVRRICGCLVDQAMQGTSTAELVARSADTEQGDVSLAEQEQYFAICQDQFQRTEAAAADVSGNRPECLQRPVRTSEDRRQRDLECTRDRSSDATAQRIERHQNELDGEPGRRPDPGAALTERQQRDLDRIEGR